MKGVNVDGRPPKVKTHWEEVQKVAGTLGIALPDGQVPRGVKLYQAKQARQHGVERIPSEALEGGEVAPVFNSLSASGTDSFESTELLSAYQRQLQQCQREAEERVAKCEERSRKQVLAMQQNIEELMEQQVALTENLEQRLLEKDKLLESRAREYECIICRNAKADTVLFPCKHQQVCATCLKEHFRRSGQKALCPSCRSPIDFSTNVHRP